METPEWEVQAIYKTTSQEKLKSLKSHEEQTLVDEQENEESKWTKQLTFVAYAATIGSALPAGYGVGVMNSPAEFMQDWCNQTLIERYDWHLTESGINILWSTIVSMFIVGGFIGSLMGARVADRFGRRKCYLCTGVLLIITAILYYTCRMLRSVEALILGRFISGLAAGLSIACLPLYLAEVAPSCKRGVLGVFCSIGLTGGVVVAQIFSLRSVFGNEEQWHLALSVYVVLVFICYAPMNYYPESPKWLYIIKGDKEGACRQLKTLRGNVSETAINREMAEMKAEANVKDQDSGYIALLSNPKLRMPLFIICAYQGGQLMSGITAIFFYSVSIFLKAGLSASAAEWTNLGVGSLNLVASLMSPYLMTRFNRRPLMLFSTFFCCIPLLGFAVMFYFINYVPWFCFGCILCILLYIIFFQVGLGPIPSFIGSELLEVAPRSAGMALGTAFGWVCNFIVSMLFPTLEDAWGSFVFIPFAVVCAMLFILTKRYVPETKGRDPSDIAKLLENGHTRTSNIHGRK